MPIRLSASCWFSLLYVFSTAQGRRRDTGAGSSRSSSAARALRKAGRLSPRRGCTGGAGGVPCLTAPLYCATQPNLAPLENSVLILPGTSV